MPLSHSSTVFAPLIVAGREEITLKHGIWINTAEVETVYLLERRTVVVIIVRFACEIGVSLADIVFNLVDDAAILALALGHHGFGAHSLALLAGRDVILTHVLVSVIYHGFLFVNKLFLGEIFFQFLFPFLGVG